MVADLPKDWQKKLIKNYQYPTGECEHIFKKKPPNICWCKHPGSKLLCNCFTYTYNCTKCRIPSSEMFVKDYKVITD